MKIIPLIPLLLLTACASRPVPIIVSLPRQVPGTTLSDRGITSVRYPENVKAYNIGRYIDPNNPFVMHERHVIYRIETTAKWNLHPNAPANIAFGPAWRIIDSAQQDGPTTAAVIAEVNRQKEATQAVIAEGKRLSGMLGQISVALNTTKRIAEQNRQLKAEVDLTKQRLDLLETEIRHRQPANPAQRGTPKTTNQDW